MRRSSVSHVKILAGDDQRYLFPWWFQDMQAASKIAIEYLYGFAVHFYADIIVSPELLDETKRQFPEKIIINTEACYGTLGIDVQGPILGSWDRAQSYILSLIEVILHIWKYCGIYTYTLIFKQDFEHSASGWIDWNLVLDPTGGPNYAQNYVDAPIIVNVTSGEIYKQPMFYGIGHFSRFITEGSIRIDVNSSNSMIRSIGFKRPDGNVVLIFYNMFVLALELTVLVPNRKVTISIPAESVQTVVYRSNQLY